MLKQLPITLLGVLLCVVGCANDKRSEVSGTVKLNGQDIPQGSINFIPIEGNTGAGAGAVIENGKYHISRDKGVTSGKNRVEIRAFVNTGRKVQDPTGPPGTMTTERVPALPASFNDQSTLIKEVKSGTDTIDFDINIPEPGKSGVK
ncbi:MAG: hypothetical protein K8U57_15535 [Planctomycetes bacterium]|nr:hypothetical protein [Planctomycetota bacterium]